MVISNHMHTCWWNMTGNHYRDNPGNPLPKLLACVSPVVKYNYSTGMFKAHYSCKGVAVLGETMELTGSEADNILDHLGRINDLATTAFNMLQLL